MERLSFVAYIQMFCPKMAITLNNSAMIARFGVGKTKDAPMRVWLKVLKIVWYWSDFSLRHDSMEPYEETKTSERKNNKPAVNRDTVTNKGEL